MIRIVNLRNYKLNDGEVLIKVDRSSVLGNPFYMHNESERDKVCDDYAKFMQIQLFFNESFIKEIYRIYEISLKKDVALGCWCYPKRCHAEEIKKIIEIIQEESNDVSLID